MSYKFISVTFSYKSVFLVLSGGLDWALLSVFDVLFYVTVLIIGIEMNLGDPSTQAVQMPWLTTVLLHSDLLMTSVLAVL